MRTEPSFSTEPEDRFNGEVQDSALLADYRQRYGLSSDPFIDDPHFPFYTGAQRRIILEKLLHLCQFSNNLLVVLGDYGVGKTRMAQALIDSLDDADDICFVEGQITSTFDSLTEEIAEQFEVINTGALVDFFQKNSENDGLAVIIVDNAHHIADEVLKELMILVRTEATSRLRLVLLAEPYLLSRLEQMDVPHVAMTDFFLEKFSLNDATDYLNFRMEMADYLGPEIFKESKIESWWRESNGQLLRLHEFAQDKLLESVSSPRSFSFSKNTLPMPHILGVVVLLTMLILGFVYWGSASSHKTTSIADASVVAKPAAVLPISAAVISSVATNKSNSSESVSQSVVATSANTSTPMSSTEAASSAPSPEATSAVKQSSITAFQSGSVVQVASTKSSKSHALAVKEQKKLEAEQHSSAELKADTHSPEEAKEGVVSSTDSDQEKTILSWSESEFTLQIVGVSTEKAVHEFMAAQPNKKDLMMFKALRQGKDWFVVVSGHYATAAEAKKAAELLPESQKKEGPWPRSLKVIQREVRQD